MIAVDCQALSIVENKGFIKYSKALEPLYHLPSKKVLSTNLLPAAYESAFTKLKMMLGQTEHISITTDIWTSDSNKSYITVTGHFIQTFKLHSAVLSTNEVATFYTAFNISEVLTSILEKWNISNKLFAVVTDNGANIKKLLPIF